MRPYRNAFQFGCSLKISAPAGRSNRGLSAAMNSACAMEVRVIAVKKIAILDPKKIPAGITRSQV